MARLFRTVAVLGMVLLVGCSKETPKASVRGTVTLDKKPLKDGQIIFATPGKAPEALPIKDGKFEGTVELGERKVEILSYKVAPAVKMEGEAAPTEPNKVNILPARYNTESQLRTTIKEGGSPDLKFNLTSNP
ncbi:MAG: hypothetical protein IT429_12580 [Gemmataceae bacterium]|nr:hypothetical protein [Gemmataceae bacterium]